MATKKQQAEAAQAASGIAEKVTAFFKENPKAPVVYSTSDEFLFENKKFASDHAATIGIDEPEPHSNPLFINVEVGFETVESDDTEPQNKL